MDNDNNNNNKSRIPSVGSSKLRKTRSHSGTLPKGSRNESVSNNLMRGRASRAPIEEQDEVPEPAPVYKESNTNICTTHATAAAVQSICQAENEPIRQQLINVKERIDSQEPHQGMEKEMDAYKREQNMKLDAIIKALEPTKNLVEEVSILRRDYNALMENKSHVQTSLEVQKSGDIDTEKVVSNLHKQLAQQAAQSANPNVGMAQQPARIMPLRAGMAERAKPREQEIASSKFNYQNFEPKHGYGNMPPPPSGIADDSDDEEIESRYNSVKDEEDEDALIPFFIRPKGEKHVGLVVIRPSDNRFDRLLNNRYYRLMRSSRSRTSNDVIDATKRSKSLEVTMGDHRFSGSGPILVFSF